MILDGNHVIRDPEDPADTADAWRWIRRQFGGVVRAIASMDKLVIAAINGRRRPESASPSRSPATS